MAKDEEPLGEHWKSTDYTPLYQLSRRVEDMATEMGKRQKAGNAPLAAHVHELQAISLELKSLDSQSKNNTPRATFQREVK